MKQEKTQLGIILAIEEASTEQLKALSRIENALSTNGPVTTQTTVAPTPSASMQGVTVKAKRRTRGAQSSVPVSDNAQNDDLAKKIAEQIAKVNTPFDKHRAQRKEQERDSKGRFISAEALRNLSESKLYNTTVASNERVNAAETDSGVARQNAVSAGVADLPLMKNIRSLSETIAEQTSEVVRIDKNGRKRDSNGRFLSKEKADELKAKNGDKTKSADGKLQDGFLKRLGSALTEHGNRNVQNDGADIVGTAAGGALWQMGRGAWDIASTAKDNAVSVNDWRKKHFSRGPESKSTDTAGHAEVNNHPTSGNLALKPAVIYPPVTAKPVTPSNAPDASKEIFEDNAKKEQVKATEKQTATLSAKDDAIIKNQEEELELLKKIAHNGSANDPLGNGLFKKLFGKFGRRDGAGRSRSQSRRNKKSGRLERLKDKFRRKNPSTEPNVDEKAKKSGKPSKTKPTTTANDKSKPETTDKAKTSTADIDKAKPKVSTASNTTPEKATKPTLKDGGKITVQSEKSVMAAGGVSFGEAANDAVSASEKVGGKTLAKEAFKTGGKVALKTGLKTIPIIGTAAGVAWDAADGYNDTEGQKKAFDLKDGQEATKREKTEMSAANVAGLGGLVPLASQGASWLANKAGFTDKTDALDIDTSDLAKGIHKGVGAVGAAATGAYSLAKGLFSTSSDDKAAQAAQMQQVTDITNAVKSGSADTVNAIDRLTKQLEGGKFGEDGVGSVGTKTADYQAPATSTIVSGPNGLNIGGIHAANRNFRNNNFGNLNFVGQEGAVLEDTPGKGQARFARFATPEDGFRALANQVSSYANGTSKAAGYQQLNTVQDIISKWAPPNENDTGKYIQTISASLGVKPTDKINTADPQVMTKLIRAISTYEGGNPTVSDGYIQNSIGSEDATTHKWGGGSYSKESQEYMAKHGISAAKGMQPVANATATSAAKTAETIKAASLPDAENPATVTATPSTTDESSLSSKLPRIAEVMSDIGNTNWLDKGAEGSAKADHYLTEKLEKVSGQHVGFRRATSDLTLPKNSGPVPESIKAAMASPDQIAKAQAPDLSVRDYGQPSSNAVTPVSQADDGVIPASMVNRAFPVSPAQQGKGLGGALSQQATPEKGGEGFFGSIGSFFSGVGHSAMKAVPQALSTVGDIAMPAAQGLLGNIVGDLGGQVTNSIGSPIIKSLASPFINKGVSAANSFIQSPQQAVSSFSMPQVLPTVTDLAKSGASNAMQQITAQMPPDIAKALQQLVDLTKQSLDAQKNKGDMKPDVVTHGGQKAPKHDDKFSDSALDALLED
ncbi:hypothetical protein [Tatumella sp. OPLPL6]|uniref:hypothetical protein n=1 Tax=Tatumella sp. OPLPL6 TaxID=1928657 RepID=UPI000C181802|nr:hypothetical protein [Tatumella sp. OPLPL6]PIJ43330.1 hypothetical protein BOM24_09190 [Tatumella sp. OPLPL6]